MKKESRKKYLLKNTIIFAIGNFGSKIISFFLVPLYTNVLTTADYGTVDLMTILTTILIPIITLNVSEAVMRFSMDKDSKKENIFAIGIVFSIIASAISLICIPIFKIYSVTSQYSILLALYILSCSTSTILLSYIRGIEKLLAYSIINIIQTAIIAILNVLLLTKYKMGISGYILAYMISYSVTIILCLACSNIELTMKKVKLDKKLLKDMLRYSILLIPNSLMWWIINSLDKVMISSMINIAANGIYAVSYKIPTIVTTCTTIFSNAWTFSAVKEKDSADKSEYTNKVFQSLSILVFTITVFLILILKPLLKIYVGKEFYNAWIYVPPLLIGSTMLTFSSFANNEYAVQKDSKGILIASIIGAITNLILNLILIPKLKIFGAAIATCISYVVVFIYKVLDTRKYIEIKYITKKSIVNYILLLLSCIFIYLNGFISFILLLILFVLILLYNKDFWVTIFKKTGNKIVNKLRS